MAFDDVRTAINRVPRNITVEANVNPALQALNELNASLGRQIDKANELSRALGQPVSGRSSGPPRTQDPAPTFSENITDPREGLAAAQYARTVATTAAQMNDAVERLRFAQRALRSFSSGGFTGRGPRFTIPGIQDSFGLPGLSGGGFTGRGGVMQPAGVVHKGEYVVPQKYVNQSTGLPDANFLSQLQNGMRSFAMGSTPSGGGGNDGGTMMVELSPFDRKLLADAGNVQLRLNGKVVAEATNRSNVVDAQRGAN